METFANVPQGRFSNHPLHDACRKGDVDLAQRLLDAGADANELGENNWAPLHHAAFGAQGASDEAHRKIIDLLVKHGADPNSRDHEDETPLHKAAYLGRRRLFLRLHARGADLEARDDVGMTPLHHAVIGHHSEETALVAVKRLARLGADIHAVKPGTFSTAMHMAAGEGHASIVEWLHALGANHSALNRNGNTPLHVAAAKDSRNAAEALLRLGADVHALNAAGKKPHELGDGRSATTKFLKKAMNP